MTEGPHSIVQKFFIMHLGICEKRWDIRVWPGQRVQVSEGRTYITDVCVTGRDQPLEGVIRVPPLICIEIVSRDDGMSEMRQRVEEYVTMGVTAVWIVDPLRRRIFQTEGASPQQAQSLMVPGTKIWIGIDEVFEEMDLMIRDSPVP